MDYFQPASRQRSGTSPGNMLNPRSAASGRPLLGHQSSRESMRQNSSIRIRRLPSATAPAGDSRPQSGASNIVDFASMSPQQERPTDGGRRRSTSAPQRPTAAELYGQNDISRQRTVDVHMPSILEGQASAAQQARGLEPVQSHLSDVASRRSIGIERPFSRGSRDGDGPGPQAEQGSPNTPRNSRRLRRYRSGALPPRMSAIPADNEYGSDVVGMLELVDPEVQTLSTLNNMQNSLFVPDLGRLINRRPTYDLSNRAGTNYSAIDLSAAPRARAGTRASRRPRSDTVDTFDENMVASPQGAGMESEGPNRRASITSQMTDSHFAVLPHGVTLDEWTDEDVAELNDHVRHLLHSRREGFKRSWRGFKQYVSKPIGLFVTIYATLVTVFGLVWVLFLIGWASAGSKQDYVTNIVDNILVALFALMGDGLAPFRVVDTYHMCFIAHYHHFVWDRRKEQDLPKLKDQNDLPDGRESVMGDVDLENGTSLEHDKSDDIDEKQEVRILTPVQRRRLQYHQAKFSKSHTFYKPHETATHHAFPLRLLVAIVVLLDCHSLFQMALGTVTWSIDYHIRPEAATSTILACSLTCNITAGILISIGDKRTRKKEVLDKMFRQNLTREAIKHLQQRHGGHGEPEDDTMAVAIAEDAVLGDVQGLKLSRKSMDAKRVTDGRQSMDGRRSMDAKRSFHTRREDGPSRSDEPEARPVSQF